MMSKTCDRTDRARHQGRVRVVDGHRYGVVALHYCMGLECASEGDGQTGLINLGACRIFGELTHDKISQSQHRV